MFTDRLAEETRRLDLPGVEVDTVIREDELVERVARMFGLPASRSAERGRGG